MHIFVYKRRENEETTTTIPRKNSWSMKWKHFFGDKSLFLEVLILILAQKADLYLSCDNYYMGLLEF